MNTEKIEKLKKSLSNSKIPADLKPKIEAEIKRLEDLDAKNSPEPKEEEKPVAKTRKPRTTKRVAKKTTARKPSETSKPKRTAMSVAKEIRKDGESWKDAMARASKMMKEKSKTATKDVETELEKLTKLVRGEKNKEKVSRVSDTNLKRDASRKAKPLGARKVTRSGETSNQYGTYKNHLGRKYVENRDKHGDRLAPRYPKNAPLLAEGGYLTDPNFGNFQNTMFADGGGIPNNYEGKTPEQIWNSLSLKQREHFLLDHYYVDEDEFFQQQAKWLDSEDKKMIDYYSNKTWNKLSAEVKKAFTSHVKLGQYAKGGGIRRKNGQTYDYGRVWTKDHNEFDKGADHEVDYRRKKLATGGDVGLMYIVKQYWNKFDYEKRVNFLVSAGYSESVAKDLSYESWDSLEEGVHKNLLAVIFLKGGVIKNQYDGRTPEDIWNNLTIEQRQHFLIDHFIEEEDEPQVKYKYLYDEDKEFVDEYSNKEWKKLSGDVRQAFTSHVKEGQYAKGGGIRRKNGQTYDYGRVWTKDHNEFDKGADHEVEYRRKKRFELGGSVVTDLAGHTGGSLGTGDPSMLSGFSNTSYTGLVGETGAMSSGEMFAKGGGVGDKYYVGKFQTVKDWQSFVKPNGVRIEKDVDGYPVFKNNKVIYVYKTKKQALDKAETLNKRDNNYELGGGLPSGISQPYMITESFGNPAQHYAKGGGIRRKNGQTYDYGRVWTKDHNEFDKSADHEVNYRKKDKFMGIFADGGETYNEKASQLKGGVDYYSVDIDLENGDEVRDLTFKSLDKAKKEFLKYSNSMVYEGENIDDIQLVVSFKNGDYENIYLNKGGKMATGGGVDDESPKIYVADLEAYNNGRLSGVWLDLADYNDADELMEAINDFLKTTGGEEYAIHDVENIPNSMYSEYMGQKDFEELYEMIDLAKENDLPLSVVQEVVSQYDASAVDEFYGKYNDAEDFAQQLVDEMGIESFIDFQYYLDVSDTDRRLLAQDMADSYVEDIVDEDGGNRIIEEAGLDVEEYEEADSDRQEEMIDEAREIVYDEYYNTWFEGLSDPYYFLVEEQGMYSAEDFANADFVRIDFEKLADALEQDYTFIYDDGYLYVFNIR